MRFCDFEFYTSFSLSDITRFLRQSLSMGNNHTANFPNGGMQPTSLSCPELGVYVDWIDISYYRLLNVTLYSLSQKMYL